MTKILLVLIISLQTVASFAPSMSGTIHPKLTNRFYFGVEGVLTICSAHDKEKGFLDLLQPWNVDIPETYREEIMRAEAKTPAAKERDQRVALYTGIFVTGVAISSLNVFLSNIRSGTTTSYDDLRSIEELGFGWVGGSPLTSFFLLNSIGGGIALLSAGFGGTMIELEQRTKIETAEKIWKVIQEKEGRLQNKSLKKKKTNNNSSRKKLKQKSKKRLDAFAELLVEEVVITTEDSKVAVERKVEEEGNNSSDLQKGEKKKGLLQNVGDFYEQADNMAAAQALLLNKNLEDRGILPKITDSTGLKVATKPAKPTSESEDGMKD